MTDTELTYILTCLSEECAETIQRITKAQRFGLDHVQAGQLLTNRERLAEEMGDVLGVMDMLRPEIVPDAHKRAHKPARVRHYMGLSRELGQVRQRVEPREPKLNEVWIDPTGKKLVMTAASMGSWNPRWMFAADRPHDDGDLSYLCTNQFCRCQR